MKTFTIDAENNISVFATKKEAAAASTTPFDLFTSADELAELVADWPMSRLVETWNSIAGVNPVTKFTNRKVAAERIWKALQTLGESPKPAAPEPVAEEPAPAPEAPVEAIEASTQPVEAAGEQPALPQEAVEPAAPQVEPEPPIAPAEALASAGEQTPDVAPAEAESGKKAGRAKKATKVPKVAKAPKSESGPREGSKTAQVVEMLKREGGATLAEIMTKMGWQKHTVRGFMAGAMKKAGYTVESFKPEGGERSYRINQ
jgi:hypothetical protein